MQDQMQEVLKQRQQKMAMIILSQVKRVLSQTQVMRKQSLCQLIVTAFLIMIIMTKWVYVALIRLEEYWMTCVCQKNTYLECLKKGLNFFCLHWMGAEYL